MKKILIITILISLMCMNCTQKEKTSTKSSPKVVIIVNQDKLLKMGITKRITEQYTLIMENQKNFGKSFFIVDTRENLIFFFDSKGKFIAKSPTIDGFDKQSLNPSKIKETLKTWEENCKDLGFKWNSKIGKYIDTTNKGRLYSPKLIYDFLGEKKVRFLAKGIYRVKNKYYSPKYLGVKDNVYEIETLNGSETCVAIHGVYKSNYRIKNLEILKTKIGSNYNQMMVSEKYRNLISENNNNSMFNNSFGCINVPSEFLTLTNKQSVGSLIFVIGENDTNFLV